MKIPYPVRQYHIRRRKPTVTPLMWWMLAGVALAGPLAFLVASAVLNS